jgi:glycosyltransferase involved in cell wall biosynthesis
MLNYKYLIATMHAIDEQLYAYNKVIFDTFDKIVISSNEMKDIALELGCHKNKLVVIQMGTPDYDLPLQPIKDKIEKIGSFGFMFPQKGWVETALAISRLKDYQWHLFSSVVEGHKHSEQYGIRFRKFVDKLQSPNIEWHKQYMDDIELVNSLRSMDLIVIPYTTFLNQHSISAAAKICLSVGVPILCTDTPYFADLNDEVYKIPNNNSSNIMEGIKYLDSDKYKREDMVKKSIKFVHTNSVDSAADKYIKLWEEI